jgi:hypothetical protein
MCGCNCTGRRGNKASPIMARSRKMMFMEKLFFKKLGFRFEVRGLRFYVLGLMFEVLGLEFNSFSLKVLVSGLIYLG